MATCRKISRISSRVTPLVNAALIWIRNSFGRFRTDSIARFSMLRVLRGSSSRPHTAPQAYSVTRSCRGPGEVIGVRQRLVDIRLAQYCGAYGHAALICFAIQRAFSFTYPVLKL